MVRNKPYTIPGTCTIGTFLISNGLETSPPRYRMSYWMLQLLPWRERHSTWWQSLCILQTTYSTIENIAPTEWLRRLPYLSGVQRKGELFSRFRLWYKLHCIQQSDPADSIVLVLSVVDRNGVWCLWQAPIWETLYRFLGFWNKIICSI